MKIIGIEKNEFTTKDGKTLPYYRIYLAVGDANEGGQVVRQFNVKSAVLKMALGQIKGDKYSQLVNREVASYSQYYDKDKHVLNLTALFLK